MAGRGNVGRTLARAFRASGHRVRLTRARSNIPALVRSLESAPAEIVFLAVPDDAVDAMAAELAQAGDRIPRTIAFAHTSGALGLQALEPLGGRHPVGSFHLLQSFPETRSPESLRAIVVAVDASTPGLRRRLARLARDIGARPKHVPDGGRVVYHAAAVFASNYVDALLAEAVTMLGGIGWSEREAKAGLMPLAEGALDNIRKRGAVAALTGPVRRGDVETVRRHLAALGKLDSSSRSRPEPRLDDLYRMLGLIALGIAKEAGLEPAAARRMRRALTQ
ncbi:MAG: Rossmann-like and DUF2520 domain-containing protein [Candidatus Dormiibacterota bacterium]